MNWAVQDRQCPTPPPKKRKGNGTLFDFKLRQFEMRGTVGRKERKRRWREQISFICNFSAFLWISRFFFSNGKRTEEKMRDDSRPRVVIPGS